MTETFEIPKTKASGVNKVAKNIKKAAGPNTTPPNLVKLSAKIVDSQFCNIINKDLENTSFEMGQKQPQ